MRSTQRGLNRTTRVERKGKREEKDGGWSILCTGRGSIDAQSKQERDNKDPMSAT